MVCGSFSAVVQILHTHCLAHDPAFFLLYVEKREICGKREKTRIPMIDRIRK